MDEKNRNRLNSFKIHSKSNPSIDGSENSFENLKKKDINFNSKKASSNFSNVEKIQSNSSRSRFSETSKQQVVSITYEEIGLFPRSFNRVFDRFFKQLFFDVENLVIQEYRFYRYLFLTTVKCVFILVFVPLTVNFIAKNYFVRPITEYYWNSHQMEIFLNSYQQKRAFTELKNFEEKIYFESLIFPNPITSTSNLLEQEIKENFEKKKTNSSLLNENSLVKRPEKEIISSNETSAKNVSYVKTQVFSLVNPLSDFLSLHTELQPAAQPPVATLASPPGTESPVAKSPTTESATKESVKEEGLSVWGERSTKFLKDSEGKRQNQKFSQMFTLSIQNRLQLQTIELAKHYNEESIEAITNFFADFISLSTLFVLLFQMEIQINITKSFLLEVFFGLDDSKKSLLILFITDLLVGYHSPNIWELFFSTIFDHYGLPESQTTLFLLVATLPVLLDVLFKYLIFRHLNRASPATVATYHAMIE
jgi:hypothetical protein